MDQTPFLFTSRLWFFLLLAIIILMLSIGPAECYYRGKNHHAAQHNQPVQLPDYAGISKTITAEQQSREKRSSVMSAVSTIAFRSADFLYKKLKKKENLLPTLKNMEKQLNKSLEAVIKKISEEHMKTQLSDSGGTIEYCLSNLKAFETNHSITSKNLFLKTGSELEKVINTILNGLLGEQLFGADILTVFREATECHPQRFLNAANDVRNILKIATDLLSTYYEMSKADQAHVDYRNNDTKEKEEKIIRRMRQKEIECRNDKAIITKTMEDLMISNAEKTNQEVAQLLYDHLSDKYDTRLWLVIAYSTGESKSGHAFSHGLSVVRAGNKNALAFVFERNDLAASEEGEVEIQAISGRLTRKCGATRPPAYQYASLDNPYDYSYFKCLDDPSPREVDKRLREVGVLEANDSSAVIKHKYDVKIIKNPSIRHWEFEWQKNGFARRFKYIAVPRGRTNRPGKYFRIKSQFDEAELLDSTGGSTLPGGVAIFCNYNNKNPDHGDALFYWYLGEGNRTIRAMRSGLCLTSIGADGSRNKVTLEECDDLREDQQHWTLESSGSIVNLKHPERCLEHHRQLSSYSLLTESRCNDGINQKFKIVY